MLVASLVTALGVLVVATLTQLRGYRLAGTIGIPVVAVYALKELATVPVFVFSTVVASVALWLLRRRTLVYGRDELLFAMVVGSAVPLVLLLTLSETLDESFRNVVFLGSILPGLAAYNYHGVKSEYQVADVLVSVGLFVGLFGLGSALVSPALAETLGTLTPPVLYSETAEVAHWRGVVVASDLQRTILARPLTLAVFAVGMAGSEALRGRYGIRLGVIAVALLAVYTLSSVWLPVLYVLTLAVAYVALAVVHRASLLYGRVLISVGVAAGLAAALALVLAGIPVVRGLSAYFVAILGGINAYNVHATPPRERRLVPLGQVATFLPLVLVARYFGEVGPRGAPQDLTLPVVVGGLAVALGCLVLVEVLSVDRPDGEAVFADSVLSGGGGS